MSFSFQKTGLIALLLFGASCPALALAGPSLTSSTASTAGTSGELTEEELRLIGESFADDKTKPTKADPAPAQSGGFGASIVSAFQSLNPNMSLILDAAAAYFSDPDPIQVGAHDPNKTGFTLQQLEMHLSASVDPYFRFESNIVFALFGVEVEEAYAVSSRLPFQLQLRAGQFLTRFGRLNPTHPHSWQFMDQPLVNGKFFGGEGSRGLGGEVSWLSPLPWYLELVGSVTDPAGACCARSFFGGRDITIRRIQDLLYTAAIKQFFALDEDWSLFFGVSGQFGPNPTGNNNRTELYGADLYLRYRPVDSTQRTAVSLQVEGMARTRQIPDDALLDYGMYAQLLWSIDPQWEVGARYEYVSGVAGDYLDIDWSEARQRASAQITFYPSHFSRIRAQGNVDDPKYRENPIWSAMLNIEVLVGAHGAHSF